MPATEPVLRRALACPAAVLAATGQTRERATGSRRMYGGRLVPPARELVRIAVFVANFDVELASLCRRFYLLDAF